MRFLLISQGGEGLGIALRLKEEGHDVVVQLRSNKAKRDYDGLLRKISQLDSNVLAPGTIVLFDSAGGGKTADRLRGQGFAVLGASTFGDQLQLDRELAMGLLDEAGVKTPAEWATVKVGPQELEISTEGWFDGYNFARPFNHTLERCELMNDNLGPYADCSGCVVWACRNEYCRIVEEGLKKFEGLLRHHGYRGMVNLDTIVSEQDVWGVGLSTTLRFDAFPALMETMTEGVGDTLAKYARGETVTVFPINRDGYGGAVRVSIPPYPSEIHQAPAGVAIEGLVRADRPHSYFYNVYLDEEGTLRSSGSRGAIAAFTGFGTDIRAAIDGPLQIAKRAEILNKQFRTDLDMQFSRDYSRYETFCGSNPRPQEILNAGRAL